MQSLATDNALPIPVAFHVDVDDCLMQRLATDNALPIPVAFNVECEERPPAPRTSSGESDMSNECDGSLASSMSGMSLGNFSTGNISSISGMSMDSNFNQAELFGSLLVGRGRVQSRSPLGTLSPLRSPLAAAPLVVDALRDMYEAYKVERPSMVTKEALEEVSEGVSIFRRSDGVYIVNNLKEEGSAIRLTELKKGSVDMDRAMQAYGRHVNYASSIVIEKVFIGVTESGGSGFFARTKWYGKYPPGKSFWDLEEGWFLLLEHRVDFKRRAKEVSDAMMGGFVAI